VTAPAVLWPILLGVAYLLVGLAVYHRAAESTPDVDAHGVARFGPVFVAAALAAFAGEHFTAASSLAQIVPKWLPDRVLVAYFVGVAHLAAATSFICRRYIRWSAFCLCIMFALFVLLMDLPGAVAHPGTRMAWSLAAREATFAIGAFALWLTDGVRRGTVGSPETAVIIRLWTGGVLVFYGIEHFLGPQFAPGVPSTTPTASWVPAPHAVAFAAGALLVGCGVAMLIDRYAAAAASSAGALMLLLTLALYVPQLVLARTVPEGVLAINFIFDTLLFGGTLLVISRVIEPSQPLEHPARPMLAG